MIERFRNREPLVWNRVNVIPDAAMVHFKHKPHARAGVSCDSCHGNVGEMTVARQAVDRGRHGLVRELPSAARRQHRLPHLPPLR